jgi:hypothetical protein
LAPDRTAIVGQISRQSDIHIQTFTSLAPLLIEKATSIAIPDQYGSKRPAAY